MSWALIAGGSKGIGLSVAEALAMRKYDLLLIARDMKELTDAKTKLERNFKIKVYILSCDLSSSESPDIIYNYCTARNLELKVLCNVAGMGGSKDFPGLPSHDLRTMIRINVESPVALSLILIPLLKRNSPSYILNIGSMAGFAPLTPKAVYASTKSALHSFSYSLRYLLKESNISVSCLCPGPVFTKSDIEQETIKQLGWIGKKMAIGTATVGEVAVRGMLQCKMIIVPGKLATLFSFVLRLLPGRFLAYISYSFTRKK